MARGAFSAGNYFSAPSALVASPPFTMACWWFMTGWGADYQSIMQIGQSGSTDNRHNLGVGPSSDQVVSAYSRTTAGNSSAITISSADHNKWNHQCGVWRSATDRQVYFNGAGGAINTTSRTPASLNKTAVGCQTNGSTEPCTTMRIGEAAVWNVALDDVEIAALAKGFSPGLVRPSALVEYLPLVRDLIAARRGDWVTNGSVSVQDHCRVLQAA